VYKIAIAGASTLVGRELKEALSESPLKAANIVLGLQGTLKPEVAPDLCSRLSDLYIFVACRLGMAGAKFSAEHAREAERVFTPIAEAFVQAVAQCSVEGKVASAG